MCMCEGMTDKNVSIYIIGIGMGAPENLTTEAARKIEEAALLIGAARMLAPYRGQRECFVSYKTEEIADCIVQRIEIADESLVIAVLMSGDSGFYSGTGRLLEALQSIWGREQAARRVTVLPGISSLSYFSARIGKPWEDTAIVNLHGTRESLWPAVLSQERVFAISGGNMQEYLKQLAERGLGESVHGYVGERLSYPEEKITYGSVTKLAQGMYDGLSVLYLENPQPAGGNLFGLPDASFIRGKVPMTKAEVRAVVMSKLRIRAGDVVYDVGAGTGSVSVEMALAAPKGMVYAIDSHEEAINLCKLNMKRFDLHNIEIVKGTAPEALRNLPTPDAVFIGGSKGQLEEIVEILLQKNPLVRLVINTVTAENTNRAFALLDSDRFQNMEAVQMQVNRAHRVGKSHMMTAENPVMVFAARGSGCVVREGDQV